MRRQCHPLPGKMQVRLRRLLLYRAASTYDIALVVTVARTFHTLSAALLFMHRFFFAVPDACHVIVSMSIDSTNGECNSETQ